MRQVKIKDKLCILRRLAIILYEISFLKKKTTKDIEAGFHSPCRFSFNLILIHLNNLFVSSSETSHNVKLHLLIFCASMCDCAHKLFTYGQWHSMQPLFILLQLISISIDYYYYRDNRNSQLAVFSAGKIKTIFFGL